MLVNLRQESTSLVITFDKNSSLCCLSDITLVPGCVILVRGRLVAAGLEQMLCSYIPTPLAQVSNTNVEGPHSPDENNRCHAQTHDGPSYVMESMIQIQIVISAVM